MRPRLVWGHSLLGGSQHTGGRKVEIDPFPGLQEAVLAFDCGNSTFLESAAQRNLSKFSSPSIFVVIVLFSFLAVPWHMEFPGQGSDPSRS